LLYDVISEDIDVNAVYDRSSIKQKREKNEIGIQSMRGGTIFGEHTVMFAGNDEIIELKHTALSKEVFAQGAVAALKAISNKENGLFTLKNLY
jgi:4-hydroxy-tetrahydrodipicolinate reductase